MVSSGRHILFKPSWARVIIRDVPRGGERAVCPRCRTKITGVGVQWEACNESGSSHSRLVAGGTIGARNINLCWQLPKVVFLVILSQVVWSYS